MSHIRVPADEVSITPELGKKLGLEKRDSEFWKMIMSLRDKLHEDRLVGDPIEKKKIPRLYRQRDNVTNLYRYAHSSGYRLCYTLTKVDGGKICAIILDLMDHNEYNKRFKYRES